jgi:transcriptional regulator
MYTPTTFVESDQTKLHDFIEQRGFATLVSQADTELLASHLPLLSNRDAGPHGALIGHMARANPQWRQADGQNVLAIFHGPHAYISPTWYQAVNVVPTWNYVAVHAYGSLRVETDRCRLLQIVQQYVDFYEADLPQSWSVDDTEPDFVTGLLDAIVGFRIVIDRIEGKWKLNQNHDETRRTNVIRALREVGGEDEQKTASLMLQTMEE